MNDYAWLKEMCSPEYTKGLLANPWSVTVGDRAVTVATNGRLLVAVDGDFAVAPPIGNDGDKIIRQINSVMSKDADRLLGRVTSADLSAWCGPYQPPKENPCDNCGGDGQCDRCRCENPHECGHCDGAGKQTDPVIRYGKVGESFVDRNRLAKALDHLSGDVIVSEVPTKLLRFEGPGWTVLLAYLADGRDATGHVPTLNIEPPSTLEAHG